MRIEETFPVDRPPEAVVTASVGCGSNEAIARCLPRQAAHALRTRSRCPHLHPRTRPRSSGGSAVVGARSGSRSDLLS